MSKIQVIVEGQSTAEGGRLGGGILQGGTSTIKELSTETLKKSLGQLSSSLSEIFDDLRTVGNAELSQVQVEVEINAEGGGSLIGTAKAGISGAISLTFDIPRK